MQAFNFTTMTAYGGKNAGLVSNGSDDLPAFATFMQLRNAGYSVKKGAKSIAIFCGYKAKKDSEGKSVPIWARVFDIIDTSAADDKEFLKWLKEEVTAGRVKNNG